ncbi:protein kinase [Archangium violaceum]|uniref:protein kinase domain-containing protein n=1 Tax=Archangium violaceum TaxID=83451 RepID=UPI002B320DDF|nr:protein kinase [Archangium violaceum]
MQDGDGTGNRSIGWPPATSRPDGELSGMSGESDLDDSFLQEVAHVPVPLRRPAPGERLGGQDGRRFTLLEELGAGAMGWVLSAWDEQLRREVALKFLVPREGLAGLALAEARAIARLDHENIIRIFDVAEWTGRPEEQRIPFLVMERLEGESLAHLMQRERPDLRRTLEIMMSVAAGLAHAHEHHIVHRDLKPSNVFITRKGVVKLLDFGLAYLLDPSVALGPRLPMAGTPPYMAPEQWRDEPLDERTDIWAAGVLLYEMLTGELPYATLNLEELRARVLSPEPVPLLRERHPELPWELESLLAVALAKEPSRRLLSAAELQDELRELEEHLRPERKPPRNVAPQRRQVTLVACKLQGLASLAGEMDAEDFGEWEAAFHRGFSQVIQQQGGFVTLCMGDEALASFGYPVAREEDSERAVRAGLMLVPAIREALGQRQSWQDRPELKVQVGIHTSMVMLDDLPQELRGRTPGIQGEAPKVAAWLALQARPDEVVLSREAHALVQRAFETEPLEPRPYSGARSLRMYRVVGARRTVSRFDRTLAVGGGRTPLVGRKRELERLLSLWERARAGEGGFVLLSGEAGMGKSRLIQELRDRIGRGQALSLRLQCWSQFSTSAFHPLIEALQRLWLSPEHSPRENLRVMEEWLAPWALSPVQVRLLGSLLSLPVEENSPPLRLTPERQMEELLAALCTLLLRVAEVHPVLVVVEDLQWADPSTLRMLGSLMEPLEKARVLGVLSARPEFRPPWPERSSFQQLSLERMPAECTARLAKEVARGRALPEPVMEQLVSRTDGIPLFIEEMTRMLMEDGAAATIPVTLQELLLARLDMLPRRRKELAWWCAVLGRGFTRELLATVTGMSEAAIRRGLAGLVAAGLLERSEEASGHGYHFRHALLQEAAYQSQTRGTRREHHRRIALTLVEHFPGLVENRPELLAHHYMEAGELKPAIHAWKQAGLRASRRYENQEAVSHLTQALNLLRGLPDAASLLREELELLIALGLPLVQLRGYHSPEVTQVYERVRVLLREVGEGVSQLELSYWGAYAYYFSQMKFQEAHEIAELLVGLGQRLSNREMLMLGHRMMSIDFFTWGDMPAALAHIEQALAHSEGLSLAQHQTLAVRQWMNPRAMALAFSSVVHSALDERDRARNHAYEALALARELDHPHTYAGVLTYAAIGAQIRREPRSTLEWTGQCITLAGEHRFRLWLWWSTILKSWALAELGQAEAGLALMLRAFAEWERSGFVAGTLHNSGMLADIYLKLGRAEEGLATIEHALAPAKLQTGEHGFEAYVHLVRAQLLGLRGRTREAREAFLRVLELAREQGARIYARRVLTEWGSWIEKPNDAAPLSAS